MEKDLITDSVREHGEGRMSWTRVGVVFKHYEGPRFNVKLPFFPLDRSRALVTPTHEEQHAARKARLCRSPFSRRFHV